jgi:hypothetical protein
MDKMTHTFRCLYAKLYNMAKTAISLLRDICVTMWDSHPMERDVEDWVAGTKRDYAGRDGP